MNNLKLLFTALIFLLIPFQGIAQDTTKTDEDWDWDMEEFTSWKNKRPTVSFHYGFSELSRKDIEAPFADNALIEIKLGYTTNSETKYADFLKRHRYNYMFLNKNSTDFAGSTESISDIESNNWQFGVAWSNGYGYKLGEEALITPYFTSMMTWTNMDFGDDSLSQYDEEITGYYQGAFRFGSANEAGLRIQATKMFAFEAGYERSIVFQRHLFWKWAGSAIIEMAAHGALDVFIREIFKSSPAAGPVVYFILKSALGYGLYELRLDKMNWPFPSAPPIAMDNIKFGVTLVF